MKPNSVLYPTIARNARLEWVAFITSVVVSSNAPNVTVSYCSVYARVERNIVN